MPAENKKGKVLIIGPGPVKIGHGSELDFGAFSAADTLKHMGFDVIAIDANPAGLLIESAETYVAPRQTGEVEKIIGIEKPDYMMPNFGGAETYRLILELHAKGMLDKLELLGIDIDAIKCVSDRVILKQRLLKLGIEMPKSAIALSMEETERLAGALNYPVIIRPAISGSGRTSLVYNIEELRLIATGITRSSSPVIIEEALSGWEKLETEILSDAAGNTVTACFRENLDPMGIHSGDAAAVIPLQTIGDEIKDRIDNISSIIVSDLGIKGSTNIQFGYNRHKGALIVLEVNPRYSRSSAFASVSTGINIAAAATKCALGITLEDQGLMQINEPEKVTLRLPVFQFEKYPGADRKLNTRMQSIGAIAGVGTSFREAFRNAAKGLKFNFNNNCRDIDADEVAGLLSEPTGDRYELILLALAMGADPAGISDVTGINRVFIDQIKEVAVEKKGQKAINLSPSENGPIIVLLNGPARIGEAQELSALGYKVCHFLSSMGYDVIAVDANPYGPASVPSEEFRTIIAPLDVEDIANICLECRPSGIVCQTGGTNAIKIAAELESLGMKVYGMSPEKSIFAESRKGLALLSEKTGIKIPEALPVFNFDDAREASQKIGFPAIILPETETPDGRGNQIVNDLQMLEECLQGAAFPVYIEKFLEGGFMAQVDAVCDGTEAYIPAVVEHIEHAGIHTGDAACVVPPLNISGEKIAQIRAIVGEIVKYLGVTGFLNAQFAVCQGELYCIGISLRASRTVQLVSKVTGIDMSYYAVKALLGEKMSDMDLREPGLISHYGVREAVFCFDVFSGVDPILGPEMRSTGQSLGVAANFGMAFKRAMEASGFRLPVSGRVLVTVSKKDRGDLMEIANRLDAYGFEIFATRGTADYLNENGIKATAVLKLYEGRPNIIDQIKNGDYSLIINTPSGRLSRYDDSYIRQAAIMYNVAYFTTIAGAKAAIRGIEAK